MDLLTQSRNRVRVRRKVRELRHRLSHHLNVGRAARETTATDDSDGAARACGLDRLVADGLAAMTADERAVFKETYAATRLALDVGEKVRDAREAAGFSQRELAARMGTSQAAVARLEAGGVVATLTTLQKVAAALDLKVTVELSAAN